MQSPLVDILELRSPTLFPGLKLKSISLKTSSHFAQIVMTYTTKTKKIDRKFMQQYKANLSLLNYRYGEFERRLLQVFCDQPILGAICLPGWHDIHVLHLLKDGLLIKTEENSGCILGGVPSWEKYELTSRGRQFVDDWKKARSLE